MIEIFQTLSIINSILLWNAVIIPGACASKGLDTYFPRFYAKTFKIGKTVSNITFPISSIIVLIGGPFILSQEIYAIWMLALMCASFLYLVARYKKIAIEDIEITKNMFLDAIILTPIWLVFFFASVVLPIIIALSIG